MIAGVLMTLRDITDKLCHDVTIAIGKGKVMNEGMGIGKGSSRDRDISRLYLLQTHLFGRRERFSSV